MTTLCLKEMGKFLWEGREKGLPCWLSQFSSAKLRQPTWHAKKNLVFHFGVERHASFPQEPVVKCHFVTLYSVGQIMSQ